MSSWAILHRAHLAPPGSFTALGLCVFVVLTPDGRPRAARKTARRTREIIGDPFTAPEEPSLPTQPSVYRVNTVPYLQHGTYGMAPTAWHLQALTGRHQSACPIDFIRSGRRLDQLRGVWEPPPGRGRLGWGCWPNELFRCDGITMTDGCPRRVAFDSRFHIRKLNAYDVSGGPTLIGSSYDTMSRASYTRTLH